MVRIPFLRSRSGRSPGPAIRETLFGDLPIDRYPPDEAGGQPWSSFIQARRALEAGDKADAIDTWRRITSTPDLESRHYLQAWHFLRSLRISPDPQSAKRVLGVVLEVSLDEGLDLVAGYSDGTARYYNYSNAAVIWERPDERLDANIDALLTRSSVVVEQIGPWEGPRPEPPAPGEIRLNFLTPSGLHFGQGPFDALTSDALAGPVISAGTDLMKALTGLAA